MRLVTLASLFMLCCSAPADSSVVRVELSAAEAAALATFAPRPEDPLGARRQWISGSGLFVMEVPYQTGKVQRVLIQRSTGSRLLDGAAVAALSKWRFKPEALRALQRKYDRADKSPTMDVCVPIKFTMRKT